MEQIQVLRYIRTYRAWSWRTFRTIDHGANKRFRNGQKAASLAARISFPYSMDRALYSYGHSIIYSP